MRIDFSRRYEIGQESDSLFRRLEWQCHEIAKTNDFASAPLICAVHICHERLYGARLFENAEPPMYIVPFEKAAENCLATDAHREGMPENRS